MLNAELPHDAHRAMRIGIIVQVEQCQRRIFVGEVIDRREQPSVVIVETKL